MLYFLAIFAIVVAGALLQRVSGMGLGLVSVPVLTLLMGPVEGVLVVNILALMNALITSVSVRQWVDWKKFGLIASVIVVGALPAAWLVKGTSAGLLQVLVGVLLLVALGVAVFGKDVIPPLRGPIPAVVAGVLAGFMNTLAGVAGPAIAVYAVASKWEQRVFAATLQPIFVVAGGVAFGSKILVGAGSLSETSFWVWPVGVAGMVVGIGLGTRFAHRISRDVARKLALSVAVAGGLSALVRGLFALYS